MSEAKPYPKDAQLARGERRYRRKVASAKTWQKITDAKRGPCRVCGWHGVQFHHLVSRTHGGGDIYVNIVPICGDCHGALHQRHEASAFMLLSTLTDAEYAYMIERGGEDYPERAYGIRYER